MKKAKIPPQRINVIDPKSGVMLDPWFYFFQQLQLNGGGLADGIVLTPEDQATIFPNSLVLTPVAGQLERLLDPDTYSLGLADTAVIAGDYGDASSTISLRVDSKGRLISVSAIGLNSDNVTQGSVNLYFTDAAARAAISGGTGIDYSSATGVIDLEDTAVVPGAYGDATHVAAFTVDQQGRLISVSSVPITTAGFSGTGAYANFTFANGLCTAAS